MKIDSVPDMRLKCHFFYSFQPPKRALRRVLELNSNTPATVEQRNTAHDVVHVHTQERQRQAHREQLVFSMQPGGDEDRTGNPPGSHLGSVLPENTGAPQRQRIHLDQYNKFVH